MELFRLVRAPRKPAPSHAAFPLLAVRLLGSILLEGIATMFHFLVFPFHRSSERRRVREIILRPSFALLLGLSLLGASLAGCRTTAPGSSFGKQVDETVWTLKEIARMDDAQGSLEDDLRDFGSGTSLSEALWDLEQIISSPDAQRSLEDDLHDFGTLELDGIPETFELLGW